LRGLEDAAPLAPLQPVAAALLAFAATPAEATPISSLVTRLSGGDATASLKEKNKEVNSSVIQILIEKVKNDTIFFERKVELPITILNKRKILGASLSKIIRRRYNYLIS